MTRAGVLSDCRSLEFSGVPGLRLTFGKSVVWFALGVDYVESGWRFKRIRCPGNSGALSD